ncbi:MAG: guanylate kinase [Clostridiales bacterium]|nr:guanylate kinase [Clostridiales bacterium]
MREVRKGMLLVISGPSGTGKGTLCERLLRSDATMSFSVSATTRKPREGEQDGVHYHFISDARYDELLAQDAFLEHATVHGHRYGTLRSQVEAGIEEGRNMLLDIDPQGALSIMQKKPDTVSVFILPPSYTVLRERLKTRNTEDPDEIMKRLSNAYGELAQLKHYQYAVVNDQLDTAFERLCAIILAEKHRTIRYFPEIYED